MKKTKIIATVGPACNNLKILKSMISAGVDVCRLNFSFGTHEDHRKLINLIRRAADETGKSVAIMQDLKGPKIRVGILKAPVAVKRGDSIILSGNDEHKEPFYIPTTYTKIASDTKPGKTILMADGRIILEVEKANKARKEVACKVLCGGTILTGKGINLPYTEISLPTLTEKDIADAKFGIEAGVDLLAMSFVRKASDIKPLRKLLKEYGAADVPIIAKLEKPEALDNLEAILDEVDGVMVARGDLADEISFPKVPVAQKRIIASANAKGKLTIVATEMLCSMIENPLPTRAEVSDVANGVLDGADMVMLSNETATGKFPVKAVRTMASIATEAEQIIPEDEYLAEVAMEKGMEVSHAMCLAASFLSHELNERAIAVLTTTGASARILSKYRPDCVIYAATHEERVYHRMAAYHNVIPILLKGDQSSDEHKTAKSVELFKTALQEKRLLKNGDRVIVLTGFVGPDDKWRMNAIQVLSVPKDQK
jgi:pyruvate kinase